MITRPKVCIMIGEFVRILPFLPTLLGTALSQRWALAGDSIPELYFFVLSWIILRLILIFVALLTKPKLFIAKKKYFHQIKKDSTLFRTALLNIGHIFVIRTICIFQDSQRAHLNFFSNFANLFYSTNIKC